MVTTQDNSVRLTAEPFPGNPAKTFYSLTVNICTGPRGV